MSEEKLRQWTEERVPNETSAATRSKLHELVKRKNIAADVIISYLQSSATISDTSSAQICLVHGTINSGDSWVRKWAADLGGRVVEMRATWRQVSKNHRYMVQMSQNLTFDKEKPIVLACRVKPYNRFLNTFLEAVLEMVGSRIHLLKTCFGPSSCALKSMQNPNATVCGPARKNTPHTLKFS